MKRIDVPEELVRWAYPLGLVFPVGDGWQATDLGLRLLREYLEKLEAA